VTTDPDTRLLRCTSCQAQVHVTETPVPFLDPERYVCGQCLVAVGQLALDGTEREETRAYDPAEASIPF
jgi:predicted RNA-binding Zn-ribbon protein involved in translation (DUF1610 family)